jgi:hypothetical protein
MKRLYSMGQCVPSEFSSLARRQVPFFKSQLFVPGCKRRLNEKGIGSMG